MSDSRHTPRVPGKSADATHDHAAVSSAERLSRREVAGYVAGGAIAAAFLLVPGGGVAVGQEATPQAERHEANYFVLNGEQTQISYATTSFSGLPLLTYQGQFGSHSFTGDQIQQQATDIGELVMAGPLETMPDRWEVTLTLVVPEVNLIGGGAATPIATVAITTTHHTTIGGPALVQGALQTYEIEALQGTAQFVIS